MNPPALATAQSSNDITTEAPQDPRFAKYRVIARDGTNRPYIPSRIERAIAGALLAAEESEHLSARSKDLAALLTEQITESLLSRRPDGGAFLVEEIQDQCELSLMRASQHEAARRFVLYREQRRQNREAEPKESSDADLQINLNVKNADGIVEALDGARLTAVVKEAVAGVTGADASLIIKDTLANLYDGCSLTEVKEALILSARMRIEEEPNYTYVTARLLLHNLREQALGEEVTQAELKARWVEYFKDYIRTGIDGGLLNPDLANYDLEKVANACDLDRDNLFQFLGLQTLADRYFLHLDKRRFELPQAFWMRVAMGLAMQEVNREAVAISFYEQLSKLRYVSSTPTLFNSGCVHSQLSSCFLTNVQDDLGDIYKAIRDNALLSKFSGGLGNDWTPVRALGSHIKGTNGESQGVIPFLKVVNDTAVAVNQGGKRKGAVCAYLEMWHLDIEEFMELRKNTGDDRRRTHDMNTAVWIPDLFMQRLENEEMWTLFTPNESRGIHDLHGKAFKEAYERLEADAADGRIRAYKQIPAVDLWRKLLGMVFETGHPWLTFKDPCNIRSPQQHCGVVHSSNLCTEITLNTNADEIAVCNLGSINLADHVTADGIDHEKLRETVSVASRMLDNVIDINFYPIPEARRSNLQHRPVGMGIMGFHDALAKQGIPYASEEAVRFADESMEAVSYYAILASSQLAAERGAYPSYQGSLWSQGILPIDSIGLLAESRDNQNLEQSRTSTMDWSVVRESIKEHGMRNSNCLAIAPTATISNIAGVSQSIEPSYQNLYVKSNMSGEFTVLNMQMVSELKRLNLWDRQLAEDLKYYDGSLQPIERIPDDVKERYATAFEIHPKWLIACASGRQKWIDQAQSLNIYVKEPNGKKIDMIYRNAWKSGLKTTYYLRSMGATKVERSTQRGASHNAVAAQTSEQPKVCSILDPDCEACQ